MNKRTYREPVGIVLFVCVYVILGGISLVCALYMCYFLFSEVYYLSIIGLLFVFASWLFIHYIWCGERCCSKLCFYDDKVVWRCMGFLPVTMNYSEIKYIGIATFEDYDRGTPMFRGDEMTYIYLSANPYPEEYRRKILKLRTRKGFIKFKYMDGICEELMKVFPPEETESLRGFYYKMKRIDAEQKRLAEEEKQKRIRNKQRKKREKERKKKKSK